MTDFSLRNSITACDLLTRASHSSFAPAFSLLPSAKRQAMEILYAYTRFTDDLADMPDVDPTTGQELPTSPRRKRQKINQWSSIVEAVLGYPGETEPRIGSAEDAAAFQQLEHDFPGCPGIVYLPALRKIVDDFHIPRVSLFHLIEGIESDIEPRRFETFDDCADYCHQVATSVGFASLSIWGTTEPLFSEHVVKAAKACGIAFQWTNILRDIIEDFRNGRFYLPEVELTRCGLTEKQFESILDRKSWNEMRKRPKKMSEKDLYEYNNLLRQTDEFEQKVLRFLQQQLERCEIYYTNAAALYPLINADSRNVYGMMWSRYNALFKKIRRNPLRIGERRVSLSLWKKCSIYFRWHFLSCRRLK